jgi:hypothetical protein
VAFVRQTQMGAGADEVRAYRQPQDHQGARPRCAGDRVHPRRRGDRIAIAPVHESFHGTFETCHDGRSSVAIGGLADMARTGVSVEIDPERTSRCFGLGADIKNFAPELRSNNSSGLRSGTVCWWVAPPHQCVTTMKSVSFPVSWLNPLSEIINEEAGVRSLEILSTVSCGISMRLRTALA